MISPLGAGNIAVAIIFPLAAIVTLVLRLRGRQSAAESWFIDDYMIIAALLSLIGYAIVNILAIAMYSLGSHLPFLTIFDLIGILKVRNTIKSWSAELLMSREGTSLVVVYAWGVAYLATTLFSCFPISKHWDPRDPGYCYSTAQVNEAFDISNLGITILILLRPITRMREFPALSTRVKAWIGGIISLGTFSIIVIIIRIALSHSPYGSVDSSYDLAKLSLLSQLELSLFVIYACIISLMTLHPISYVGKNDEEARYEKPELAADDVPRKIGELDSAAIAELPVPQPELDGTEHFHQLDDTSMTRQQENA
ncbi:hypothetical protein NPX13_g7566 [Xylaria arbuscula]|uniref:Rhodopsin domain-containing protein n=1 Tax=Xylaria arbuscula TaxID=114810 RepID=A0A9W8NA95_9PEZI|nr:hypothetical protein NPX13_g7566 [Xylaria arbuscula]